MLHHNLFLFVCIFRAETNHLNVTQFSYKVPPYTFVSLLCYITPIMMIRKEGCCSLLLKTMNSLSMKLITVSMIHLCMAIMILVMIRTLYAILTSILASKGFLLNLSSLYLLIF